jgi:hypothetical protein
MERKMEYIHDQWRINTGSYSIGWTYNKEANEVVFAMAFKSRKDTFNRKKVGGNLGASTRTVNA